MTLHQPMNDLRQKLQVRKVGCQMLHVTWELRQDFLLEPALLKVGRTVNWYSVATAHFEEKVQHRVVIEQRRCPADVHVHVESTEIRVLGELVLSLKFFHRLFER